jgi:hypothetical protein
VSRAALAALLALASARTAAAAPAAAAAPPHVERDVVDVSPPGGVRVGEVTIENRYGDVTVIGHDKEQVSIEARKHAPDEDELDRLKVQLVPDPSGAVYVTTLLKSGPEDRALGAGSARIDLVVRVPRRAHVQARLWRGRAEARGLDRGVALAVDHGDIAVASVEGPVDGETSFGAQRYEDVFGVLDARAVEGDLLFERIRGRRLAATIFRGGVTGSRIAVRELDITSRHGDVRLGLVPLRGGRYTIAAGQGDVVVTLDGSIASQIRARTAGRIELPRRLRPRPGQGRAGELVGYLGSGARPVLLDVSSQGGAVTVAEF